jgi:hypothetical protein
MAINELDDTICLYTVGREDGKVLPRSFKTLAEAEAYLAKQDQGVRERSEFYLDGPEQDNAVSHCLAGGVCGSPIAAVPTAADPVEVESHCTSPALQTARGAWTRQIEELCRALEAQPREHRAGAEANKE